MRCDTAAFLVNATLVIHWNCSRTGAKHAGQSIGDRSGSTLRVGSAASLLRDDLRTRSDVPGFRRGDGAESGERREDGTDDHTLRPANSESVLGEFAAEAQSPRGAAASGGMTGTWVPVQYSSQGNSARDAVIASWRNERRSRV